MQDGQEADEEVVARGRQPFSQADESLHQGEQCGDRQTPVAQPTAAPAPCRLAALVAERPRRPLL